MIAQATGSACRQYAPVWETVSMAAALAFGMPMPWLEEDPIGYFARIRRR